MGNIEDALNCRDEFHKTVRQLEILAKHLRAQCIVAEETGQADKSLKLYNCLDTVLSMGYTLKKEFQNISF